jgi:hypothetical protein
VGQLVQTTALSDGRRRTTAHRSVTPTRCKRGRPERRSGTSMVHRERLGPQSGDDPLDLCLSSAKVL